MEVKTRGFLGYKTKFIIHNAYEKHFIVDLNGEVPYHQTFMRHLKKGDIVYDVGGFIGTFGLIAAHFSKRVYIFEPDPTLYKSLEENLILNPGLPVTLVRKGLSDKAGSKTLYTNSDSSKPTASMIADGQPESLQIDLTTIDIFSNRHPAPTAMKIDTEGWELFILQGAKNCMKNIHLIGVELHDLISQKHFDYTASEVIPNFLQTNGYSNIYSKRRNENTTLSLWTR